MSEERSLLLPIRVKAMLGGFRADKRRQDMTAFYFYSTADREEAWTPTQYIGNNIFNQWQVFIHQMEWIGGRFVGLEVIIQQFCVFCGGAVPAKDILHAGMHREMLDALDNSQEEVLSFSRVYDEHVAIFPMDSLFEIPTS